MLKIINTINIDEMLSKFDAEEKQAIIYRGFLFRLPELNIKLERAKRKIKDFEKKYQTAFIGKLPDDASCEYHEDYIEWKHWIDVSQKLQPIIQQIESMLS